jgi:uncharacterized membrane protein
MINITKSGDLLLILIFLIVLLVITAVVSSVWSLSGFIGLIMIFSALFILYKRKGNIRSFKSNPPFYMLFILGVVLFFASYAGLQVLPFCKVNRDR